MSQPIPVDILSDSDSDADEIKPSNFRSDAIDLTTPPPLPQSKKKQRTEAFLNPSDSTVFIIDDDPTPRKRNPSSIGTNSSSTPSFVAETPFSSIAKCSRGKSSFSGEGLATELRVVSDTPMSELLKSEVPIVKCNTGVPECDPACSLISNRNSAEINGLISLESDNESESIGGFGAWKHSESVFSTKLMDESELDSRFAESSSFVGSSIQLQEKFSTRHSDKVQSLEGCSGPSLLEDDIYLACADSDDKAKKLGPVGQIMSEQENSGDHMKGRKKADEAKKPKRISKDERLRLKEEKKQQKEREKLLKAASKAEAAEMNKCKKEMQKWEKGKYALKSIVAEIDKRVVEMGSIGGHLLTRFAEKGLSYRITSNPVERTIVWTMVVPEEISANGKGSETNKSEATLWCPRNVGKNKNEGKLSKKNFYPFIFHVFWSFPDFSHDLQIASERIEISYVLIIYEAEEFCNFVMNESLMDHVQSVQQRYPHHTICYLTNRLMAYINKREQAQYKNPANYTGWKRPAVEEVLTKLATDFFKVHSRQCVDEAELAEHVVGLTCSLASCQFRKKLTRLSVNANGSVIPKDCVDKNLIKKSLWLKALVAIPKVQPRFAIAIWKKYPTMKSLLSFYMDPTKSVHEKEFLLKDLTTEGLFGDDRRLGEVCSTRIYRILMAQCGSIKTDDVENGADFFSHRFA
ncbi:hypothetical protein BUALT_Bualt11G0007800 [Buddleja alternifolia]|uniref:ERCC4 domain-containing protein n=1 Tax=Buddleja alternifolia TaxID=168488 RepID=A0AAV6X2D6_9LAMI|nr:hypothetical protein BUALT_Bualt11G0007800 [Buddleja alternifolia]